MEWIRKWLDERRVNALKQKVEKMKAEAAEAEVEPLMPAMETISRRIRLERLVVLERAVNDIERRKAALLAKQPETENHQPVSQVQEYS
jgi:hypothetical protein